MVSYKWNTGAITSSIVVSAPGTYSVTIVDNLSCTATDQITIVMNPVPLVEAGRNLNARSGESVMIGGTPTAIGNGPFIYEWTPANGLNYSNIPNPITQSPFTATYIVKVTDGKGCSASDNVTVSRTTGIDENQMTNVKFTIFPNPTEDYCTIQSEYIPNGVYCITLLNSLGATVKSIDADVLTNHILMKMDMTRITKGIYILAIQSSENSWRYKILKQ